MSEHTIPQYYHFNMGRGVPLVDKAEWNGAVLPVRISPSADKAILIKKINLNFTSNFAVGIGDVISISPYGNGAGATSFDLENTNEIMNFCDKLEYITDGVLTFYKGEILFEPCIVLRGDSTPVDEFAMEYVGAAGIAAGTLNITVKGWEIDLSSLGLD